MQTYQWMGGGNAGVTRVVLHDLTRERPSIAPPTTARELPDGRIHG